MRLIPALAVLVAVGLTAAPTPIVAQSGRLNPIIALQEKGLPVFGIAHPAITAHGSINAEVSSGGSATVYGKPSVDHLETGSGGSVDFPSNNA